MFLILNGYRDTTEWNYKYKSIVNYIKETNYLLLF